MEARSQLGSILVDMGICDESQIQAALEHQQEEDIKIGKALVEIGAATPRQISEALAAQFDLPLVDLEAYEIPAEVIEQVDRNIVTENNVIPVKNNGLAVTVAMTDPLDLFTLDNLRFLLESEVEPVLCTEADLKNAVQRYYGMDGDLSTMYDEFTQTEITMRDEDEDVEGEEGEDDAPVIRLVSLIISEAVKMRASDIHIEPMEKRLRIRYRVDGVCREVDAPPKRLQGAVLQRIKIMSEMDVAERRKCQDGRIKIRLLGKELDLRVSLIPATNGESIVMRILDKEASLVGLEELGFLGEDYKRFQQIIKRPNGIFLVTGPTGSGKTTTLYAALKDLNQPDVKIITAENPVEYHLDGINQCQVRHNIGFDFARILRAMLRQAPNIILVGEIRDKETAEIAIQAALTGHLVFSTLHTNDAPGALTRLIDMGVKPFLVASSVQAIMAQRLVRVLCPDCKEVHEPSEADLKAINLKPADVADKKIYRAVGCGNCTNGYKGRRGIFELLEMSAELREMTFNTAPTLEIRRVARLNGMSTLQEDAVRKVVTGLTTIQETLRVTAREDIEH